MDDFRMFPMVQDETQSAMRMYDDPRSGLTSPFAFQLTHAPERAHGAGITNRCAASAGSPRRMVNRPTSVQSGPGRTDVTGSEVKSTRMPAARAARATAGEK